MPNTMTWPGVRTCASDGSKMQVGLPNNSLQLTRLACGRLERVLPARMRENGWSVARAAGQLSSGPLGGHQRSHAGSRMIDRSVIARLTSEFGREPILRRPPDAPSIEAECLAWRFPYDAPVGRFPSGARDRMMGDLLARARQIAEGFPTVAYKGGGLMAYSSQGSIADEIILLDSADQFDIPRFESTRGNNHPISTEELIRHLMDIHTQFGILIDGAAWAIVEFMLSRDPNPEEAEQLTSKIFTICPDVEVEFLGLTTRRVVLAWD